MSDLLPVTFSIAALALAAGVLAITHYVRLIRQRFSAGGQWTIGLAWQVVFEKMLQAAALLLAAGVFFYWYHTNQVALEEYKKIKEKAVASYSNQVDWQKPGPETLERDPKRDLIVYGRDLIVHTSDYFGPFGLVRHNSINALNCQNCHLDAGSKPFGNNFSAVAATYPKVRPRSGQSEDIPFRVNDCFMRSLNGQPIDTNSREMRAMVAYIRWLGSNVPKDESPKGSGIWKLPFLDRAADPEKGKVVFETKCASCHGRDGQGLPMPEGARSYPPLWGAQSYNEAAGLFRLSRLAGYVKTNMPFGASYQSPQISDEEAWDVAAFINSQPRPQHRFLDKDWPDIAKKPFDHPFGPYKDTFPESQHKFGPFQAIVAFYR